MEFREKTKLGRARTWTAVDGLERQAEILKPREIPGGSGRRERCEEGSGGDHRTRWWGAHPKCRNLRQAEREQKRPQDRGGLQCPGWAAEQGWVDED